MIGQIVSHYRILEKLGEGGMGVVYVAEDTRLRRRVAVKFSSSAPDERGFHVRFLREARAISVLSHPHIATVYDYGETADGRPFIVMELINGRNLGELLRDNALTIQRAVEIVEETAEALAEAHRHGIVHRDIKPTNVMVNNRGAVKVLDFGLAKQLEEEKQFAAGMEASTIMATHTRSDAVIGTLLYLSPEQATAAPVDARSDLFALGAMLYECVAGRPAFSGATAVEVCAQILHVEPPPPSRFNQHVPPELDRITLKALAKRPEERYQSAERLIADLRDVRPSLRHTAEQIVTQQIHVAPHTPRISALTSLTETLRQPRFSFFFVITLLTLVVLTGWGAKRLWRPALPQPTPQAVRLYRRGESALRDGSYYAASNILDSAVGADPRYALAHARLAEAWMELDYEDKAKDAILRAKSLIPDPSRLPPLEALYLQAITDVVMRNYNSAVENYQRLVEQSPEQERAHAYVDLGRAYEKNENIKKATESYLEATVRDPQAASAFLRLGVLYGREQNLPAANTVFETAEKLYKSSSNYEGMAEVHYQRGALFNKMDRINESRAEILRGLQVARATNNTYQQVRALLQLGVVSRTEGNTKQAQQHITEAIELARADGLENLTTHGLIDLGNVFLVRDEMAVAEKYYKQALEFARRNGVRFNEARALLSLGSLNLQQHNADEAVSYVEQALPFVQRGGYRKETLKALNILGQANDLKGNYEAALRAFEQQLQLAEQTGDQSQMAFSYRCLGTVLTRQEKYSSALVYFDKSYEIHSWLGSHLNTSYDLMSRGDVLWRLGQYAEARAALGEALSRVEKAEDAHKSLLVSVYLSDAQLALSTRNFKRAEMKAQQAISLADTVYLTAEAQHVLGLALAQSGKTREGVRLCNRAFEAATRTGDPRLLASALLSLAHAQLENDDVSDALLTAKKAREYFARFGQQESEWRACFVASRAAMRTNDHASSQECRARAHQLLANLRQEWGEENFNRYLARPDVRFYREQVGLITADIR